jgi:hypothetical protein
VVTTKSSIFWAVTSWRPVTFQHFGGKYWYLLRLHLLPEGGDRTFLRNVSEQDHTQSHLTRYDFKDTDISKGNVKSYIFSFGERECLKRLISMY